MEKMFEKNNMFGDDIARMERYDFSRANLNEENRVYAITKVASICYQNPKALNSDALYNRLMAESIGLPSSSFEFIPILIPWVRLHDMVRWEKGYDFTILNMVKYGMWIDVDGNKSLITNYRALVYDVSAEKIPEQYLKYFNTEEECDIIKEYVFTFLFKIDLNTRSQMVRHRSNLQELCISGDSVIKTTQGGRSIKRIYDIQEANKTNKNYKYPRVKSFDFSDNVFKYVPVKEIFKTGQKEVFEVVISYGANRRKHIIKATKDHKFYTKEGWKPLEDIELKTYVGINCHSLKTRIETSDSRLTISYGMIVSITSVGVEDTYDLEVDHPDHNYVANSIVVHNSRRYVSGNKVPFTFYISDKMKNVRATISRDVLTESISDTDNMDNMTGGSFVSNKATFSIGAQDLIDMSLSLYEQSLKAGVKPEEARRFIPQAAYTDIWMSMNKDQLDNYLKLRLCKTAQWEIRQTAIAITESIGMEGKYER